MRRIETNVVALTLPQTAANVDPRGVFGALVELRLVELELDTQERCETFIQSLLERDGQRRLMFDSSAGKVFKIDLEVRAMNIRY